MNREKAFLWVEGGFDAGTGPRFVSVFIVVLIVVNVVAVIAESHVNIRIQYQPYFDSIESFSITVFTIEYLLRVWVAPCHPDYDALNESQARVRYVATPRALIDLFAVLPAYIAMFFAVDLRVLRLLRLLRLLKLTHYFQGINLFFSVMRKEAGTLLSAVCSMLIMILLASSLMYAAEHEVQPEAFGSISSSFWWAAVTMTTVGYGDVTPVTALGQFLATIIMLLGVGVVALPAGMLAAKFGEELQTRKDQLEQEVDRALLDGEIGDEDRQELEQLRARLGISEDTLDEIVHMKSTKRLSVPFCPHCGMQIE